MTAGLAALASAIEHARDRVTFAAHTAEHQRSATAIAELDSALADLQAYQDRAATLVRVKRAELTYRPDGAFSFFADLAARSNGVPDAKERLARHDREMRDLATLESRDVGSAALNGIVPPAFLADQLYAGARPYRTVADVVTMPLPATGMDVFVPALTTGMSASAQSSQTSALTTSDPAGALAGQASVRTIAAAVNASRQLVERGGQGTDALVALELGAALGAEVERQLLNGAGTSGELQGYLVMSGTGSVTYTSASPTAGELLAKLGALATSAASGAKRRPDMFVMHQRRLDYFLSRAESAGIAHAIGAARDTDPAGTVVRVLGVPVLASDAVPTNLSSTQDAVLAVTRDAAYLYESTPEVLSLEVGAPSQYRMVVAEYAALPIRNAAAIAKMTGTGLAAVAS